MRKLTNPKWANIGEEIPKEKKKMEENNSGDVQSSHATQDTKIENKKPKAQILLSY